MRNKKQRNVAVLLNLSRPYDRQIVRGISRYMHSRESWLLYVEENPADKIPSFTEWSGDGVIVDTDDRRIAEAMSQFNGTVVGIGCLAPDVLKRLGVSTVKTDDQMIAQWAADHLLERGLEQFAYCGMRTHGLDRWADVRRDSFRQHVAKHGHPCQIFTGRWYAPRHWTQMLSELTQWLARLPKPIGIMACNDLRGRHLLEACRQLDLHVPDDVAVVGVDNDELMCELAIPPLTSVALGTQQMGYQAAMLLDQLMHGRRRRPRHLVVPPTCLVPRRSTDMVAVDDPIVSGAMRFIRERAATGIAVPDLVRHLDVSRSTIETRFKRCLGRTVHEEVQRVRLDTARRLLTTSDLPLSAVAQRAGYSTVQYMSAVFRRELGHAPGQLRRQASHR
jgi:LacI family transcriptional regulator